MKIAITPISVSRMFRSGEMDIEKFMQFCAELEIDGIDLLDSNYYPWFWKDKKNEIRKIPGLLEKYGLKLAACATANNFAKLKEEDRKTTVEKVKSAIAEAAELGAPMLRVFGGHHYDFGGEAAIDHWNGLKLVMEGLEKCVEEAARYKVVLALENHGRLPGHSYEVEAIIKHFNSPWVKVMFDCANFMGNAMDEPENPLRAYERLKKHVVHVHVKDTGPAITSNLRRMEGYVAGMGKVPLRQFAALLEENNYQGFCSLEYEASAIVPETIGVKQSIEYLKRIRAIHQMFKEENK
ncbi:MAG: AP endonuclease, family 2 [Candidatus Uhrbacteria bacterium GW2011_GWF2_39_13]|uniref:AP endonuclease, family 2 n=1 Tax=Candidatus Uhrbacteria bacterium GW2011_GWF2_39_13 TaxID=1618995 RepID=A0A0G0Q1U9_9BACT|nr:MAG: AP endonuclease, family 2 [Candidatus Uhrbacteria bacterium GW2011_GWF2_39_13]